MSQYMAMSSSTQVSIAEAMVTYQDKVTDEDTCQVFVPFLSDVRVGTFSEDTEDLLNSSLGFGGHTNSLFKSDRSSPPSSPNISKHHTFDNKEFNFKSSDTDTDYMELQLDYFFAENSKYDKNFGTKSDGGDKESSKKQDSEKSKKQTDLKSSIKAHFRNLSISHLSSYGADSNHSFSMTYTTKEKRPKTVLKIGKKKDKPGDVDSKFQSIEGINRLIVMSKSHHLPLKVAIDSQEWSGVKFFQVSSQWQTHIKYLPVGVGTYSTFSEHL